ncbi:short-chain dehydrogenase [Microbacterium barkeri]|uniref:Short-chain dehydrogenase n=1 Tax=Microbacterium barkeri TaxID=33917 RepID=A0A9W6LWE9_9MICO|nr:SDR family NAD(P)-dependent oxidoreductase [Microbacterium barkeri]MDR6877441.1 3-oxoacyl-[acyl-carrier protein] reductase [Microbacterium barkeri]GLJ61347.1 short-chain dehydrogenase [Microbacterium barkeri]
MSESRTVIVTGAGRGIGAVIAQRLAREGDTVFALDRDVAEVGEGITGIACDITSDADVAAAVERVLAATARIDVLVNNAGINLTGPLETADLDAVRACFDVNVVGLLRMCQAVIPTMKRAGTGRIVNAASFAAIVPAIGGGAYAATKSAVVQLTRVLAGELGPWDITVNAYAPGMVPTAMNGFADMPAAQQDELLDTLTLRRWGTADEVADVVAFLASPAARYVTGTLIDVSGGKLATQIPARAHRAAEA